MTSRRAPVAILALILAGCSAGGGTEDESSESTQSAGATSAPSETMTTASVDQWVSEVVQLQVSVDETQTEWEDATCSSLAASSGAVDCQAYIVAMGLNAQTVAITLGGLTDPSSPAYLGDPPTEIAALVESTKTAAEDAAAKSGLVDCSTDCTSTAFEFERAWNDLRSELTAWAPYL